MYVHAQLLGRLHKAYRQLNSTDDICRSLALPPYLLHVVEDIKCLADKNVNHYTLYMIWKTKKHLLAIVPMDNA